jgi:hypothetical protein
MTFNFLFFIRNQSTQNAYILKTHIQVICFRRRKKIRKQKLEFFVKHAFLFILFLHILWFLVLCSFNSAVCVCVPINGSTIYKNGKNKIPKKYIYTEMFFFFVWLNLIIFWNQELFDWFSGFHNVKLMLYNNTRVISFYSKTELDFIPPNITTETKKLLFPLLFFPNKSNIKYFLRVVGSHERTYVINKL